MEVLLAFVVVVLGTATIRVKARDTNYKVDESRRSLSRHQAALLSLAVSARNLIMLAFCRLLSALHSSLAVNRKARLRFERRRQKHDTMATTAHEIVEL